MTVKERIHNLVEQLPPENLEEAERLLDDLRAPRDSTAGLSPEERRTRISVIVAKHKAGTMTEEERLELLDLSCGMSAHLPGRVDAFLREKHEETEREEARLARHYQERAA